MFGRKINFWTTRHCTAYTFAVLVGIIIGVLSGFCAWVLKLMIGSLTELIMSGFNRDGANWWLLLLPVTGIVLTVFYQHFILKRNIQHGVEKVQEDIKDNRFRFGAKMIFAPMIASTLTLGFGGSAGSEGPIATTSASIGSWVGNFFGMSRAQLRLMIGIGAGAGIAGIFKAPIGGALFTIEVLMLEISTLSTITLIIGCIASSLTAYTLSGFTYDINVTSYIFFDTSILPWVFVLGILCGFYSIYYSAIMRTLRKFYEGRRNIWVRAALSGGLLSICVFLFPILYGEGYGLLTRMLDGTKEIVAEASPFHSFTGKSGLLMLIMAGVVAVKPVACVSTNSGGGVAGDFAPTLFAGGLFGFLFAFALNDLLNLDLTTAGFAYIGMAGVMAGAVRAPLMAIFLTAEMCDGYQFFLPLTIAATISFCIVHIAASRTGRTAKDTTGTYRSAK